MGGLIKALIIFHFFYVLYSIFPYNIKYEENLKYEDSLLYEDSLKYEDDLK